MKTTGFYYGGTIPYFRKNGEFNILLGRETSDGTWSPFGGVREAKENILQVAVRETWEETMGLLGNIQILTEQIRRSRLGLVYRHLDMDKQIDHYSFQTFIEIPTEIAENLPTQFQSVIGYNQLCNTSWIKRNGCHEKSEIRWFPLRDVIKAAISDKLIYGDTRYPVRKVFDLVLADAKFLVNPFRPGDTNPDKYRTAIIV